MVAMTKGRSTGTRRESIEWDFPTCTTRFDDEIEHCDLMTSIRHTQHRSSKVNSGEEGVSSLLAPLSYLRLPFPDELNWWNCTPVKQVRRDRRLVMLRWSKRRDEAAAPLVLERDLSDSKVLTRGAKDDDIFLSGIAHDHLPKHRRPDQYRI